MGVVQNRMFILHHEGAHRLLFTNRKFNDFIGLNVFGPLSFGGGGHAYRRGHSNHHRDEFGPKEPDFLLYALFPRYGSFISQKTTSRLPGGFSVSTIETPSCWRSESAIRAEQHPFLRRTDDNFFNVFSVWAARTVFIFMGFALHDFLSNYKSVASYCRTWWDDPLWR